MSAKHSIVLSAALMAVMVPGFFFWVLPSSEGLRFSRNIKKSPRALANSNVTKSGQLRELEPSQIQGQTKSVKNEPKVILNDPALKQAWGVEKSNALKAWEISQGSDKIVVAVIDTGCDLNHEDLAGNYWVNSKESKTPNGQDTDGNGFVDDYYGWNFAGNNNDLTDNHGHGTHIAGIIGAIANNGKGIVGISPKVRIMCLKYYDPKTPSDHLRNTVAAIHYAIKMGAHIINYSGGGLEPSPEERAAIELAEKKGILFVAAAGNERSNSDVHKYYPADYGLSNIISVTAINPSSQILASSNYGTETVDIAAPGQNILSTLPGSNYGFMTGTSQATAFVTGAAVLVMAHHPEFNYLDVKKYILSTGDVDPNLIAKTRTSRQLNLFKALVMMDSTLTLTGLKGNSNQIIGSEQPLPSNMGDPNSSSLTDFNSFGREFVDKIKPTRETSGKGNP
jgi:subtilisin family serine protease